MRCQGRPNVLSWTHIEKQILGPGLYMRCNCRPNVLSWTHKEKKSSFISDQGKEQTAEIVLNAIHQAGGQHYATTAYHSKSNPLERSNFTIGQLLQIKLIDSDWPKEKWRKCLPEALYTMRMSPDTQTKDFPFLRVYGRRPYTRIDTRLGKPFDDDTFDM